MADFYSPCCSSPSRLHQLVLLLFYFHIKTVNLSLHFDSFHFHLLHDHLLHFVFLVVLPLLPQVESLLLPLHKPSEDHVLQVFVDANIFLSKDFFPMEEVASHICIDIVFGTLETSTLARLNCLLGFLFYLFAHLFDGWLAVSLKSLFH